MKTRKRKIINKKFQLEKCTRFILGVCVIMLITIVSIGYFLNTNNNTVRRNNDRIMLNIERIKDTMELQESMYINLSIRPFGASFTADQETANQAMSDYNTSVDTLKAAIASSNKLMVSNSKIESSNYTLLLVSIVVFIIGIIVLFYRMLIQTHRMAGPIHVMTEEIQTTLAGENPHFRELRDLDDFRELHQLQKQLIEKYIELKGQSDNNS